MLDTLTSTDFMPFLHHIFRLYPQLVEVQDMREDRGEALECELIEVSDLGRVSDAQVPSDRRRSFSLIFSGPCYLPQRIYVLEHETLGFMALFLVPVGLFEGKTHYQAVFN